MTYSLPAELQHLVAEWTRIQTEQASRAIFEDSIPELSFTLRSLESTHSELGPASPNLSALELSQPVVRRARPTLIEGLSVVGGLDISFREDGNGEEGIAVLAILSFPEMKLLRSVSRVIDLRQTPYVPSFLSFREAEPLASLLNDLRADGGPCPQALFVDGNGRWHVREAGSAVAIGLLSDLPTIGVAKEYHPLSSSPVEITAREDGRASSSPPLSSFRDSQKGMRSTTRSLLKSRGDWTSLLREDGLVLGSALLSSPSPNSTNPVFVSQGHRVSLETAIQLTLACSTEARVPEPIRQADAIGRREARERWGSG